MNIADWTDEERKKFEEAWSSPRKTMFIERGESVGGSSLEWRHAPAMFQDIKDFHEKFSLTFDGGPRILPRDLQGFRNDFLDEELKEYKDAVILLDFASNAEEGEEAGAKALDALVDLVYVALGTAYLHGFNFDEAWRRVQTANMAKVRCERPGDSKRGSTYDVIKPEGWVAPDHSDLVKGIA